MSARGGRTDPALWERCKARAKRRLGGRHSARAMQLAGHLYRAAGGRYAGAPTAAQRKLVKWTRERWQTATGEPACRRSRGRVVCDRYLPAAAWALLTPAERRAARRKKRAGRGQYVPNTAAAKAAGRRARGRQARQR